MKTTEKLVTTATAGVVAVSLAVLTVTLQEDAPYEDPPQPSAADGVHPRAHEPGTADEPHAPARDGIPQAVGATTPLPPSTPHTVRIPAIEVEAPLAGYGLDEDGSPRVPPEDNPYLAAWYHGGVTPGAGGTALINGHVDNSTGPAVFYDLGALQRGDTVEVDRADGRTAVFTVEAIDVFDRADFPDELVYGHSDRAELRLITCGGGFSDAAGGYLGNVVVFAQLTGER